MLFCLALKKCSTAGLKRALIWLSAVLYLSAPLFALDPTRHISQYAHTAWRIQDGLLRGTPHVIAQTVDGYLWVGTESGLLRFDGVRFTPWTPPAGKQLPSVHIESLMAGSDGSLWIGTRRGLAHWKYQDLVTYPDNISSVQHILEDRRGDIWITRTRFDDTNGPLCKVAGSKLQCFGKTDGIPFPFAVPLVSDSLRDLWVGGGSMVGYLEAGTVTTYTIQGLKGLEDLGGVEALAVASDDTMWVGAGRAGRGLGLQKLVHGSWKPFVTPKLDGSSLAVTALLLDRDQVLWVGTVDQGIYRIHGGDVDHFRSSDGLSSDSIYDFCEDREGNIWVATSEGIDSFRELRVASLSTREGLSSNEAGSVLAAKDGTVWIGNLHALDILRNGTIFSLQAQNGLPGQSITSLLEDHLERLWVGIDNGLYVYERGQFHRIREPDGSPLGAILALTEDVNHDIWAEVLGRPRKLARIHGFTVSEELAEPQMPAVRTVVADPRGGIWLTPLNGNLLHYRNGQIDTYSLSNPPYRTGITNILANPDGSVLGSTAAGLVGWRNGKMQMLTVHNGLPCDAVYSFVRDNDHATWLYMSCGLVKIDDAELQRWWKHPEATVEVRVFDVLDGARPGAPAFRPAASRSPDGRLWFANQNVLQFIDPHNLTSNPIPPPVHVEEIVADHKSYPIEESIKLPRLTKDLEIDYTALSFVSTNKVFFRYKLDGHDKGWQEVGTRRQAFYTNLAPGNYLFQVMACNNDGIWNEAGASVPFYLAPAYYQTSWFRVLSIAVISCGLWLIYLRRVRQVANRVKEQLSTRLDERERVARELHDTLLQSFQGLTLRFQTVLKHIPEHSRAYEMLKSVLDRADETLIEGRQHVGDLRRSSITAEDLPASLTRLGEEFALASSTQFTLNTKGTQQGLDSAVYNDVLQIGREALSNAFRHASATRIDVEIGFQRRELKLTVRDDGSGMSKNVLKRGRAGHWGLAGMQERAQKIGARLNIRSGPGMGTEVDLTIPGRVVYIRKPRRFPLYMISSGSSRDREWRL